MYTLVRRVDLLLRVHPARKVAVGAMGAGEAGREGEERQGRGWGHVWAHLGSTFDYAWVEAEAWRRMSGVQTDDQ